MLGETNLDVLLQTMQPLLAPEEYVFCTIDLEDINELDINSISTFREKEGLTLILERQEADNHGLTYKSIFSMITLTVHSSLDAVGFLAAIATKLAEYNISVNAVSAYYHDHLFVPVASAQKAMVLLEELATSFADCDRKKEK